MTIWQIFRYPVGLAALSLLGLVWGLVADGWPDALAVVLLALPCVILVAVVLRGFWQNRSRNNVNSGIVDNDN